MKGAFLLQIFSASRNGPMHKRFLMVNSWNFLWASYICMYTLPP